MLGVARTPQSSQSFASSMKAAVKEHARDPVLAGGLGHRLAAGPLRLGAEFADEEGDDRVAER